MRDAAIACAVFREYVRLPSALFLAGGHAVRNMRSFISHTVRVCVCDSIRQKPADCATFVYYVAVAVEIPKMYYCDDVPTARGRWVCDAVYE